MQFSNRLGWATGAVIALAAFAGCKQPGAGQSSGAGGDASTHIAPYSFSSIVLGEYGSLTGSTATFGVSSDRGIQMAVAEANAGGGIIGKSISVQKEDDQGRADAAATVVQKLITQDNVLAVLGEVASSLSLAAAPICQQAGVPMISPTSTNPKVTEVGDYIFRTCFIDPFQGTAGARFAKNHLHAKTAAVLTDIKNAYSVGLADYFKTEFSKTGQIVADEKYSAGDTDFRAQLTNIKEKKPDVIFIPGYYTEVGNIAVQARSEGLTQPLLGGDGWDSPKLTEIGKDAIVGSYFTTHYSSQSADPRVVAFVAEYKRRYHGETPSALAAVAYDATRVLLDAIRRAGSTNRDKIRDAIATTKNFPGVTGNITIDKNRNAVKPLVVVQVKGPDNYGYVSTVNPYV